MSDTVQIYVTSTDGQWHKSEVPKEMRLDELAADFFDYWNLSTGDGRGNRMRAVIDLVDPEDDSRTRRLNSKQTVDQAELQEGSVIRIFPESMAAAVDERDRLKALVADHHDLQKLAKWNDAIDFDANTNFAPTQYEIIYSCPGIHRLDSDGTPVKGDRHRVEIVLGADYPRVAPSVHWLTPVFHPNIHPNNGAVCLGVIMERYSPNMGLARLATMLMEMVQYKNYDYTDGYNREAQDWAEKNQDYIVNELKGHPYHGPVIQLFEKFRAQLEKQAGRRTPVQFEKVPRGGR
jgi:ubiquitin-protein ligase